MPRHGSDRIAEATFRNVTTGDPITDGTVTFVVVDSDQQTLLTRTGTHLGAGRYQCVWTKEEADAVLVLGRPYRLLAVLQSPTAGKYTKAAEWVEDYDR